MNINHIISVATSVSALSFIAISHTRASDVGQNTYIRAELTQATGTQSYHMLTPYTRPKRFASSAKREFVSSIFIFDPKTIPVTQLASVSEGQKRLYSP